MKGKAFHTIHASNDLGSKIFKINTHRIPYYRILKVCCTVEILTIDLCLYYLLCAALKPAYQGYPPEIPEPAQSFIHTHGAQIGGLRVFLVIKSMHDSPCALCHCIYVNLSVKMHKHGMKHVVSKKPEDPQIESHG